LGLEETEKEKKGGRIESEEQTTAIASVVEKREKARVETGSIEKNERGRGASV
jgi:hypothetical protein